MPALPIAAIVYTPTDNIEALIVQVARTLEARGVHLGGVIQHDLATVIDDPCAMELEDLASGARFSLSQELGRGSEACRLDPAALAQAAVMVRDAVTRGAELVIFNKFGAQEAAGASRSSSCSNRGRNRFRSRRRFSLPAVVEVRSVFRSTSRCNHRAFMGGFLSGDAGTAGCVRARRAHDRRQAGPLVLRAGLRQNE